MIKKLLVFAILALCGIQVFAVTDKEMEEARTITAQAYLRYANDGSGYLDDVKATTMAQLEGKLKAKEKENLKAFKAVKVPSDYASWDKTRLVEFWSVTFFASPELTAKGKIAKSRVKSRLNAMKVAAPSETAPDQVKEEPKEIVPTAEETQDAAAAAPADDASKAGEILEKQEEILADQTAIAKDEQERQPRRQSGGSTWIYVVILIVLIGVVVWLVVFAANMMKKQAEPLALAGGDPKAIDHLQKQYEAAKNSMEQYRSAFEDEKKDNQKLRNEIKSLKEQIAVLQSAAHRSAREPEPRRQPAAETSSHEAYKPAERSATQKSANEFYLGRVNNRGLFVRADRQFNPGNSIYRLETRDGLVGTFHVVDRPEVIDLVADRPVEYLGGGCLARDIEDTDGISNIVTENAGTAVFEGGAWKVLRRTRIRYE